MIHYVQNGADKAACGLRTPYNIGETRSYRFHHMAWQVTDNKAKVTCKLCLKAIEKGKHEKDS